MRFTRAGGWSGLAAAAARSLLDLPFSMRWSRRGHGAPGFRARIARNPGLDVGPDVAQGPDGSVFYIQFGHAWARDMD